MQGGFVINLSSKKLLLLFTAAAFLIFSQDTLLREKILLCLFMTTLTGLTLAKYLIKLLMVNFFLAAWKIAPIFGVKRGNVEAF
ncbi:MAG: hypothetical protein CVV21_10390 [Candidatus Goldiibacteriota bacterium HGW-Goldbacteria-1]|jgi:hypothetical protein|nr:MAG: hypothetical protein CVV21_10390 [Candidatus Goldiibacteriota bacterium HGW-Goldbacteria-1]